MIVDISLISIQLLFHFSLVDYNYRIMKLRIQSSDKKKLIEEQSHVREIQMKFLDRDSSRQYTQVMEEIMKSNLRKQSHRTFTRSKSSNKSLHKQYQSVGQANNKTVIVEESRLKTDKVEEIKSQEKPAEQDVKKIPYKFSIKSFLIELIVAYSATFAILYFIKLANFPYFQILLIIAFTVSIDPWKSSNILMLVAIIIVIGNYFLNLSFFTYPCIIICYYSVLAFNQNYKKKQLFVLVLIFTIIYGFIILPAVYRSLPSTNKVAYIYVFPLLMLLLRTIVSFCYWIIDRTAIIFLQLPLFITGLQYGTILTQDISTIQFWYLMILFTLQIVNDRTQFLLRVMTSITESCTKIQSEEKQLIKKQKYNPILPAHANGHACLNSFHLFLLVYIYSQLNLFTAPYNSQYPLIGYVTPWYKPIIVWLLSSIYEIMSIVLQKNNKNKLLFGFTSNRWWRSILRGFMLSLGMWVFYLGLGVGALIYRII